MISNESLGAYGVMYVVINKKSDVLALLLRNGVVVPSDASDVTIALAVTNLLKVSKTFYNEFSKLLVNTDVIYGMSANMSGSYANMGGSYANYTGDSAFCKNSDNKTSSPNSYKILCEDSSSTFDPKAFTTKPKDTKAKDTSGSTDWLNKGLELLQTGFQGYLQLDDNKTKRELADASVRYAQSGGGTSTDGNVPPPNGLSTGAIVGISLLGVTVVGLVIYLVTKKK
jgi:hypothetical protein